MFGGTTTSEIAIVTPDRVAQWKPASLSLSSVRATVTIGYRSARSFTIAACRFFGIGSFMNG